MTLLLLLFAIPLVAGLGTLAIPSSRGREVLAWAAAALELLCALPIIRDVSQGHIVHLGDAFAVDALSAVLLLIATFIGFATSLFSVGYLRVESERGFVDAPRHRLFYTLFHFFLLAVFLAVTTNNLGIMWVAIEATTLATAFLVSFYNRRASVEAAWKFLIINSVGLLIALFGTILLLVAVTGAHLQLNGLSWEEIVRATHDLDPRLLKLAFLFSIVGYGTKIGLAPMHTWLPDTYSQATAPASALLSSVLSSVAFYALLRVKSIVDGGLGADATAPYMLGFGIASVAIAAAFLLVQRNYKRMIAYSSIEHFGLMALATAFGPIGLFATLYHLVTHAVAKALLFFTAGSIRIRYGSTKVANVRGLLTALPVTGVLFFAAALAITGMPPFGIFTSEFLIFRAGITQHPWVVGVVLALLAVIFIGILRTVSALLFGGPPEDLPRGDTSAWILAPSLALALLLLALGFGLPGPLGSLITDAVSLLTPAV